jgi:hypothetical protein
MHCLVNTGTAENYSFGTTIAQDGKQARPVDDGTRLALMFACRVEDATSSRSAPSNEAMETENRFYPHLLSVTVVLLPIP